MKASNIHFEMAERSRALNYGGIGAIHLMGQRLGLAEQIDSRLELLKRHLPYHESDHVLNLAYNALLDGQRLEDIELRRNDEAFLDGLGAQRIPDPTTSGDFTRRFNQDSVLDLMEAINATRQRVWEKQPPDFLQQAFIDTDGTLAGTLGECKGGMALSYKALEAHNGFFDPLGLAPRLGRNFITSQPLKGFPSRFGQGLSQLDNLRMSIHAKNELYSLTVPAIQFGTERKIGVPAQRDFCGTRAH